MKTVNPGLESPLKLLTFFILSLITASTSNSTSLSLQEKVSNYLKSVVEDTQYIKEFTETGNKALANVKEFNETGNGALANVKEFNETGNKALANVKECNETGNKAIALANGSEPKWGYGCGSGIGPSEWAELSPDWSLCSTGTEQSPIGILSFDVSKNERVAYVQTTHHPAPASVVNDGNLIRLKWKGGFLHIDGILYELHEAQFHSPSEHTIDGKRYPLEMQMMHNNGKNGDMAILSILFKLDDKDNKFLGQFFPHIQSLEGNSAVNITGVVEPKGLELKEKHFYQYRGSLTTPPCAEGVVWIVMKKKQKVSPMQLDMLYAALKHENFRPIQALKGRTVYKGK